MDTSRSSPRASRSSLRALARSWSHRYVIALGVALVLTVGGVIGANVAIEAKLGRIERVEVQLEPADPGEPGNFLLIGSDTRQFQEPGNEVQREAFGDPTVETGQRSDTIMVAHVEPGERKSLLVSFPRDLWVDIPGQGEAKINAAFNDGPQSVIDTLQSNFGIPINHYVEVDFASFEGIVNAIGKVPVFVPAEARDTYTGFSVPGPGCYELDGQQALQYVRSRAMEFYDREAGVWRDTDAIPDFGRINRQQNFIRRLGSLAYQEALGNPLKANEIADDVVPQLTVDGDLSREDIFKLVKTFRTIDPADPTAVEMVTLPTRGETSSDGQSVLELDQPDADAIIERLKSFTPAPVPGEGILPAQVDVRVLNGSGVEGLAASTLDSLQRQYGFSGAGFGNAEPTDETLVRYRPGLEDAAELVRSYLGGAGRLVESSQIADADVVVVLGPDFDALSTPPGVTPAATAPASTASTTARNPLEGIPAIDFQAILEGRCVP